MPSTQDVENEILERAGITKKLLENIPMMLRVFDGAGRDWEAGRPNPGNPNMVVHSMFGTPQEDESIPGDVRVYSFPQAIGQGFARYVVNRQYQGFTTETMSDEGFIDEVAGELRELALAKGVLEECPFDECEGVNPSDAEGCAECGRKFEEEEEDGDLVHRGPRETGKTLEELDRGRPPSPPSPRVPET